MANIRLPFDKQKGLMLLFHLDMKGIACSKGSACQSGSNQGSHVLNEILSGEELDKPSLRFSFSMYNTKEELDYTVEVLRSSLTAKRSCSLVSISSFFLIVWKLSGCGFHHLIDKLIRIFARFFGNFILVFP